MEEAVGEASEAVEEILEEILEAVTVVILNNKHVKIVTMVVLTDKVGTKEVCTIGV